MTTAQDQQSRAVIAAWNAQADEHNQWETLGDDEKIDWAMEAARALPAGMEPVARVCQGATANIEWRKGMTYADLPAIDGQDLYTAAQVQAMGRVPPEWQAVPVEPTIAMLIAGDMPRISTEQTTKNHAAYAAMLAAAPRPPAVQELKPLTPEQIHKWWASENGLEDCDMGKLIDFTTVVREFESKLGIK